MKNPISTLLAILCVVMIPIGAGAKPTAAPATSWKLHRVADLPLPGASGRFDYEAVDPASDRLYVNQMGVGRTLVFDLRSRRLVGQIHGLHSPTGITLAPDRRRLFISDPGDLLTRAWGDGALVVADSRTLKILHHLPADGFPDGSAWVPSVQRLFVSNERGGIETVIGGKPLHVEKHIRLGGGAGNSAYDATGKRVLVNVQTQRKIAVIDPVHLEIEKRISLPATCQHNHGLLVDDADHLAFVACDGNARLLVLRLPSLTTLAVHRLGRDPDVLAIDHRRHRLWVAAESGIASVFAIHGEGLTLLWRGRVGGDAHSVAIDPATGDAWFPLADRQGHPVMRIVALTRR